MLAEELAGASLRESAGAAQASRVGASLLAMASFDAPFASKLVPTFIHRLSALRREAFAGLAEACGQSGAALLARLPALATPGCGFGL